VFDEVYVLFHFNIELELAVSTVLFIYYLIFSSRNFANAPKNDSRAVKCAWQSTAKGEREIELQVMI
jgi:hypothetical protein